MKTEESVSDEPELSQAMEPMPYELMDYESLLDEENVQENLQIFSNLLKFFNFYPIFFSKNGNRRTFIEKAKIFRRNFFNFFRFFRIRVRLEGIGKWMFQVFEVHKIVGDHVIGNRRKTIGGKRGWSGRI